MDFEDDDTTTPSIACSGKECHSKVKMMLKKKNSAIKFFLCFRSDDIMYPCVVPKGLECKLDGQMCNISQHKQPRQCELNGAKCGINQHKKPERCEFFQILKDLFFNSPLVKKFQKKKSPKFSAKKSSITSSHVQEWSDHQDVPRMITKTTTLRGNTIFTYVKENEEIPFSMMPSSLLHNEEKYQDQWINKEHRRLSHILKAISFKTSLARKIHGRNSRKRFESNESSRSSTKESCDEDHGPRKSASSLTNSYIITSSSLPSTSSSSTVSRSSSHSRSLSEKINSFRSIQSRNLKTNLRGLSEKIRSNGVKSNTRYLFERNKMSLESITSSGLDEEYHAKFDDNVIHNQNNNKKGGSHKSASGLCFLLMSLVGLIFYGKLCAILCTLMWLVCVPLWSFGDYNFSTNNVNVVEQKKIIMREEIPTRSVRIRTFQSQ